MNTNWSSPKTNLLAGMNSLRKALASGHKARLVREYNERCQFPIREKHADSDFRNYDFSYGTTSSVNIIKNSNNLTDIQKELSLNYCKVFGDKLAADEYYQTGKLLKGSLHTPGFCFLVHCEDLIQYYNEMKEYKRAARVKLQYRAPEHAHDTVHWFDFFSYKNGCPYGIKKFKKKLWVVELLENDEPRPRTPLLVRLISLVVAPLKRIPSKSVLRMDEYRCVTFRWGDVIHGFSIEFHIPKKLSFN